MICDFTINNLLYPTFFIFLIEFFLISYLIPLQKLFFTSDLDLFISHFLNSIIGTIRFLLTPLPFHMANGYNFFLFQGLVIIKIIKQIVGKKYNAKNNISN